MSEAKNKSFLPIKQKVIMAYLLFLVANTIYLSVFAMDISYLEDEKAGNYFYVPLNKDQDKATVPYMRMIEEGSFEISLSNNIGVAYIYFLLKKYIGFSYEAIPIISFIFNNILIIFCYLYFARIGLQLGLKMNYRWLFFLNPSLVYFSQLINKDIPSLLFILALTYYLGKKKSLKLLCVSLISFVVRMQLLPVGILSFWLYRRRRYILSLFLLYLATSLLSAIVLPYYLIFAPDDLMRGDGSQGLTVLLQSLNQKYYIGSIVLNPLRIIQYLYDQLQSVFFITDDGRIDLYRLRDIPFVLALVYSFRPLITLFTHMKIYMNTSCRPLITVTFTYMMVLLMHYLIHARYLFPISLNLILLGVFVALDLKRNATERQSLSACLYQRRRKNWLPA